MNRIRIRRPRVRVLSPDPPDPDIARAKGARADRAFRNGARDMMAWAGGRLWLAAWTMIRGQDGPPRAGVYVGMHLADQRGGAAHRSRPAALGSVAGRLPAHRQPPARSGLKRNGAVTRAGAAGQDPGLSTASGSQIAGFATRAQAESLLSSLRNQ